MSGRTTSLVPAPQADPLPVAVAPLCPAQRLSPEQRQGLALQVLAGSQPVARPAREHQVSRQFLYRQADTARLALEHAFDPPPSAEEVLFHLPVTRSWLRQLILALVLSCHSPYRGVLALLRDLFDTETSLGTVHNTVQAAVTRAREINASYDPAAVRVGAHDEIFQAGRPVLVGVDTASTFCYLLSQEEHRDADTWGVRLLESVERGFAPEAIVADFGTGLRAGQAAALPEVPCRGDAFHLVHGLEPAVTYLENRAYEAIDACARLERERGRQRRQGRPTHGVAQRLRRARAACDAAIALADDVRLLGEWLRRDVLALAGPGHADRLMLYDFILDELRPRVASCPHRLGPLYRLLKSRRDDLLGFARALDEELGRMAMAWGGSPEVLRRLLNARCRDERDPRRWVEGAAVRSQLRGWYHAACRAIDALVAGTVRASSLVENLNSRLRTYFSLRRHLGPDYLELLRFYLNHRVLERSERPERRGRTPAEFLTGAAHGHWLELLGFTRFARPA
ncbi:MAG TPA: hypothetical protein VHR43_04110 [Gemmatimonadales bacterium]|jgi:hypothetical protein|nr:hypothetical protein [Gemmatimonadales bacterium]